MKPKLTLQALEAEAAAFATLEPAHREPMLLCVTDCKAADDIAAAAAKRALAEGLKVLDFINKAIVPGIGAAGKNLAWHVKAGSVAGDYCEEDPAKFDKDLMWASFDVIDQFDLLGLMMVLGAMGRTQD
jgi:hypothetical protein